MNARGIPAPMAVTVIGAGAIGSTYAGMLAAHGNDVTIVETDRERVDALARHGIRLAKGGEPHVVASVRVATSLHEVDDAGVVLVLVKGHALPAVADDLARQRSSAPVISLQNGVGVREQLVGMLGAARPITVGSTTVTATVLVPGVVAVADDTWARSSRTIISETGDPASDRSLARLANELECAGLPCRTVSKGEADLVIWKKAATATSISTACALSDGTIQAVLDSDLLINMARQIFNEVVAVAAGLGVEIDADQQWDQSVRLWETIGQHRPSMTVDLRLGRKTEVSTFHDAITALGAEAGVHTPMVAATGEIIRNLEPSGRSRPREEDSQQSQRSKSLS